MSDLARIGMIIKVTAIAVALAACTGPQVSSGIYDPYEVQNREIHEANRQLDEKFVGPASNGYGEAIPEPVRLALNNFAINLGEPRTVVNDLMQFRLGKALNNTARFLINSTIGIGGIFDPASEIGLEERFTDFGETLHVWGFKEGPYLEIAVFGPSTTRDTVGMVVDFALDPLGYFLPGPTRLILPAANGAAAIGYRYRYSETVDSVLHDSADSYAQTRLLYLENRRFQLGQVDPAAEEELYDIYEEDYE